MSKTYDMIADSFNELITDYQENDGKNLTHETLTLHLTPTKKYTGKEVKDIRLKNKLTQSLLAKFIGVSKKTVEAWEAGRNVPNGPSSRLLEMLESHEVAIVK